MREKTLLGAACFVVLVLLSAPATGLECLKLPEDTDRDLEVEVKGAVGRIGPVKGADSRRELRRLRVKF